MQDPRTPKKLRVHTLSVLVIEASKYGLNLLNEIFRTLDLRTVHGVRDLDAAKKHLAEQQVDVIVLSWEPADPFNGLAFVKELRRANDSYIRRLPVILITSTLTREMVLAGRDAGIDEFVSKPIAPAALQQRLQMVIETPRPFVDHAVYIGPCRRRKNPADYHGEKRREDDRPAGAPMFDADEEAAAAPIRVALSALRTAVAAIRVGDPRSLHAPERLIQSAKHIAAAEGDRSLGDALLAFEAYVGVRARSGGLDPAVVDVALNALEQLAALPVSFAQARNSVAVALGQAIQRKLVA
jgi:DNA-binding response OmpR family regulator